MDKHTTDTAQPCGIKGQFSCLFWYDWNICILKRIYSPQSFIPQEEEKKRAVTNTLYNEPQQLPCNYEYEWYKFTRII